MNSQLNPWRRPMENSLGIPNDRPEDSSFLICAWTSTSLDVKAVVKAGRKILACGQRYLCMMMYADEIWIWICSECSLQRYLPQNKRKTAASPRDFLPPAPAHRPGKCGYVHPEDQLGSASQVTHEPCGGVQLSPKDSENAASHNLSIFSLEEMQSR